MVFQDEVHDSGGADAEVQPPVSKQSHSPAGKFEKVKWKKIARQLLEQVMCMSLVLAGVILHCMALQCMSFRHNICKCL